MKFLSRGVIVGVMLARCGADELYPVAPQSGPSCGFFANVPALTLATGVDISSSTGFIAPIYQLHRGDDRFLRSFSKEKFYELFAIPYTAHEFKHDDLPQKTLTTLLSQRIETMLDVGLSQGKVYSLRVIGVFGGPHNALLMAKEGDVYVLHDPFPGTVKRLKRDQLASWMLVPTSATRKLPKKRYITNFLEISLPQRRTAPWKKLSDMPSALSVSMNDKERAQWSLAYVPREGFVPGSVLAARMAGHPRLDFAALPSDQEGQAFENAINETLTLRQLKGVLHLAMFTLSLWHMSLHDRMPVLFLDGRPHLLISYQVGTGDKETTLTFLDGSQTRTLTEQQALTAFKESGSHYATLVMPVRQP